MFNTFECFKALVFPLLDMQVEVQIFINYDSKDFLRGTCFMTLFLIFSVSLGVGVFGGGTTTTSVLSVEIPIFHFGH